MQYQQRPTLRPLADVYETEQDYRIVMDMPGVDRDDIDVTLEDQVLTVIGKNGYALPEGHRPFATEFTVSDYSRSFSISDHIDPEGISAAANNGVVTITMPKVKEAQPKRIQVAVG